MNSGHSILGASGSSRWLSCPGSIRMSAGIPKISSMYAEEGTAAHQLAENCLRTNTNAKDHIGTLIAAKSSSYEVTEEMAEAVQIYLDTIREDLKKAGPSAKLLIENKFHLDFLYSGMFGTNDAAICQPFGLLQVYDYKHGAGVPVDVVKNPQLLYYALGAAQTGTYDEVEVIIIQPRAPHSDGPIRGYRISIEELDNWGKEVLLPGAIATENPDAPLHSGDHCKFCPAIAVCPEQKSNAIALAKEAFAEKPTSPPAPDQLSAKELKKILDAASLVEAWFDACREHVKSLLTAGRILPEDVGYKLVAGRSTREWTEEESAKNWLVSLLDEDAYTKKLLSPAQAEKKLKGDAKKAIINMITEKRGVQLAPLSDKRDAIQPAATAFEAVEM